MQLKPVKYTSMYIKEFQSVDIRKNNLTPIFQFVCKF